MLPAERRPHMGARSEETSAALSSVEPVATKLLSIAEKVGKFGFVCK